ncbi:MAG: hypothetical protein AAFV53_02255 [Myxococcota bacterium]
MDESDQAGHPSAPPLPKPRKRKRRRGPDSAFVSGTSTEFLGRKPLPRAVRYRPLVFILGPRGVGKSRVAQRLVGAGALHLDELTLLELVAQQVLERRWPMQLTTRPDLIIETPYFLVRRPGVSAALRSLLRERVAANLRTIVIEAVDHASVQKVLMESVPLEQRATIVLRFPVGRGRQRFAARVCDELQIPRTHSRAVKDIKPWNYANVYDVLRGIRDQLHEE